MWKKIKEKIKIFNSLTRSYHPSILSSAIVFYILMVLLPIGGLVLHILGALEVELDGFPELFATVSQPGVSVFSSAILIVNLIWVSSQLTDTLNVVSDVVYVDVKRRVYWKRRIYSFLITSLFVLIIVGEIVAILVISYLIRRFSANAIFYQYPLLLSGMQIIQLLIQFVGIWFLTSFIYKYVIPVKVKFWRVFRASLFVTVVWFALTFFFQSFWVSFKQESYTVLYGALANIFLFLIWLYSVSYVFIAGLIYNYYLYKKKYNN